MSGSPRCQTQHFVRLVDLEDVHFAIQEFSQCLPDIITSHTVAHIYIHIYFCATL